jgi:hypothetical protein
MCKGISFSFIKSIISLTDISAISAAFAKDTFLSLNNHNKGHRTKPQEIIEAIKTGKIRKGDWIIIGGSLKAGKLMQEARKAGVKVVTRLNSNFVAVRFGIKSRKEDIISNIKPIRSVIDSESNNSILSLKLKIHVSLNLSMTLSCSSIK